MRDWKEQTTAAIERRQNGHFITSRREEEEERELQMLTRGELISRAISPDMPSYSPPPPPTDCTDKMGGRRTISIADGQSKKGKKKQNEPWQMQQEFPAGASWFSLSLSAANRSTTCDKMTKYVENGSGRRARASFLPPSSTKQLGKFMNHKNWGEKNPVAGLFFIILYKEQLFLATCVYCRAMCFSSDVI